MRKARIWKYVCLAGMHLPSFAVHRLADDRWEILSHDDDPRRPPWRRVAIINQRRSPVQRVRQGGRRGFQ